MEDRDADFARIKAITDQTGPGDAVKIALILLTGIFGYARELQGTTAGPGTELASLFGRYAYATGDGIETASDWVFALSMALSLAAHAAADRCMEISGDDEPCEPCAFRLEHFHDPATAAATIAETIAQRAGDPRFSEGWTEEDGPVVEFVKAMRAERAEETVARETVGLDEEIATLLRGI